MQPSFKPRRLRRLMAGRVRSGGRMVRVPAAARGPLRLIARHPNVQVVQQIAGRVVRVASDICALVLQRSGYQGNDGCRVDAAASTGEMAESQDGVAPDIEMRMRCQ